VHRKQKGRPARSYLLPIMFDNIGCGARNHRKVDIALPSLALLTASYLQPSSVNNIEFRWPLWQNTGREDWVKFVLTVMRTRVERSVTRRSGASLAKDR
jgi:hypothetical protein